MNRIKNTAGALCAIITLVGCGVGVPAAAATADISVRTDALAVTPQHALFTLDFDFLSGNDEPSRIPIAAEYAESARFSDTLHYEISEDDGQLTTAEPFTTAGLVLSDQPIRDGAYVIPPDTRATFTLVVLFSVAAELPTRTYELSLAHLPYYAGEERREVPPERRQHFTTSPVTLNGPLLRIGTPSVTGTLVE